MILRQIPSKEGTLQKARARRQEALGQKDFPLATILRDLIYFIEKPWGSGQKTRRNGAASRLK